MKKKLFIFSIIAVLIIFMVVLASCGDNGEGNTNTNTSSDVQEYTIQYTDNTGNHTITVKNGDVYSLESIPSKTGYTFKGLFDLEEGGTQYVSATGNSLSAFTDSKNMTLFPQFEAKEYTLVLDYQGAEVTGTREIPVSYDSVIGSLPINLIMENKTFSGWYTEKDKSGIQIADKYGILPDKKLVNEEIFDLSNKNGYIYLYAGFDIVTHTVTLYCGDNSQPEEFTVEHGTDISQIVSDYRFDGMGVASWSKIKNDTNKTSIFNGKIENDIILYACEYGPVIDLNTDGGEEMKSIISQAGVEVTLKSAQKENYKFLYWKDPEGNQYTSTMIMPEESLTLKAVYQAMIVFNENGGNIVDDISLPAYEDIQLPVVSKENFVFAGWYTEKNQKYTATKMPTESIVLKAGWYAIKSESFDRLPEDDNKDDSEYIWSSTTSAKISTTDGLSSQPLDTDTSGGTNCNGLLFDFADDYNLKNQYITIDFYMWGGPPSSGTVKKDKMHINFYATNSTENPLEELIFDVTGSAKFSVTFLVKDKLYMCWYVNEKPTEVSNNLAIMDFEYTIHYPDVSKVVFD